MKDKLTKAIELRTNGKAEEALEILKGLIQTYPKDPDINYQTAWTYDSMGKESDAVVFYETAIKNGLTEDRQGAMLGLGSTYRCLGEYQKSLDILDQAIKEFAEDRSLRVFRALTLHNMGKSEDAIEQLLTLLLDTTSDESIKSYDKALRFYSDRLSETWK